MNGITCYTSHLSALPAILTYFYGRLWGKLRNALGSLWEALGGFGKLWGGFWKLWGGSGEALGGSRKLWEALGKLRGTTILYNNNSINTNSRSTAPAAPYYHNVMMILIM